MGLRRYIFLLSAFLLCGEVLNAQADSTHHYSMRKVLLSEARYVNDIAKNLDERAMPVTLVLVTTQKGKPVKLESPGSQLSDAVKMVLIGAQAGSKIFCDLKYKVRGDSAGSIKSHAFVVKVLQ